MTFKYEPVTYLTAAAVVIGALLEADREFHVLPGSVGHWLGFAAAAITLGLVGWKARRVTTPLVDPQNNEGERLVPASDARNRG